MKVAILGYGLEGKSVEQFFTGRADKIQVFDNFKAKDLLNFRLKSYDLVFRSPSIPPDFIPNFVPKKARTSVTKYFFDHCPCPIIGVTGTKGKGTTCSLITSILESMGETVHLLGNIGKPALDSLDQIKATDVVVYEMSSFQLWDLEKSPHVSVVLRIEPDHLNVHKDFEDYVAAKAHIVNYQSANDFCIFYRNNEDSVRIADQSAATKIGYPKLKNRDQIDKLLDSLQIPGRHNRENAEAAISAVFAYYNHTHLQFYDNFLRDHAPEITAGLKNFSGLPHRIQLVRELNGIFFYDDNYSTAFPSTDVAIKTFTNLPIIYIGGGLPKDDGATIPDMQKILFSSTSSVVKAILIGSNREDLAQDIDPKKYQFADSLEDAVKIANRLAKQQIKNGRKKVIVLMSPGAASFDMFESYGQRGDLFQELVMQLK